MHPVIPCLIILLTAGSSCQTVQKQDAEQGIYGKVLWVEGNQMPGPGHQLSPGEPVVRTILIYPLTKVSDTKGSAPLFKSVIHEPVSKVQSDKDGSFRISLPPGAYSVFVQEEEGLFANLFDGDNNIHPVVVKKGEMIQLEIKVNYMAAY